MDNNAPFWIAGTLNINPNHKPTGNLQKKSLGKIDDLPKITKQYNISDIIITDETIERPTLFSILDYCASIGIDAWFSPKLLPIIDIKLIIDTFCGLPMILFCAQKNNLLFNRVK